MNEARDVAGLDLGDDVAVHAICCRVVCPLGYGDFKGCHVKRRGFFGLMGGAVVAGPAMAQQAMTTGLEGLSLGFAGGAVPDGPYPYATAVATGMGGDISPFDPSHWAQRELADFMGRSAEEWAQIRLDTYVASLDPDIAIMRSISLTSKIRMQRDRNFELNRARSHRSLTGQLADAIKRFTS